MANKAEPRLVPVLVMLLLGVHAATGLWAVSKKSVTYDEILHVTGGFFFNRFNDFRIHPENGILPQRWAALPAALSDIQPPPLDGNVYWRTSDAGVVSHQFFYEGGHDHWPLLMRARAMMLIFPIATGLLIFCWARALFGAAAGVLGLTLFVLDPNVLAHGPLATSDAASTFFLLASVGAFWRVMRHCSWLWLGISGLTFGLACVAKFSAVLLIPIFGCLFLWQCISRRGPARLQLLRQCPFVLVVHGVTAVLIIWAFYGFRYSAFSPDLPSAAHFVAPWEHVLPHLGIQQAPVEFARTWQLLPEAFLYGYAWVIQSVQARSAFLAGEYSITGWPTFFLMTFAWKTPLIFLVILLMALALALHRWSRDRSLLIPDLTRIAPLLILLGVYWAASLTSKLNIGHRHLLPIYPVLYIWSSALGAWAWKRSVAFAWVLVGLAAAQGATTMRTWPHFLAYFNSLAGGPQNGWRLLVDSSIDWGQDLPSLAQWLKDNRKGQNAYLSYFGSGNPDYYKIDAERLVFTNNFKLPPTYTNLEAGYYCISATMLQQVYLSVRGPWTLEHEREYQQLRAFGSVFSTYQAGAPPGGAPGISRDELHRGIRRFGELRLARLCHVLRARNPDAHAGYSILIYKLTSAEVTAATAGSLGEWRDLIERFAATR